MSGWPEKFEPVDLTPYEVHGGRAGECPRYVVVPAYRWTAVRMGRPMPSPGLKALWKRTYETEDHFKARVLHAVEQRRMKILRSIPCLTYSLPIPIYCHYDEKTPAQWAREYRIERLLEKAVSPERSHAQRVASLCRLADLLGMSKSQTDVCLTDKQAAAFLERLRSHQTLN